MTPTFTGGSRRKTDRSAYWMVAVCLGAVIATASSASAVVLKVGDTLAAGLDTLSYVDPQFQTTHVISTGGLIGEPSGLASLGAGEIILASITHDAVLRIDALDGSQQVISVGGLITGPVDVAVESNGQILVTNFDFLSQTGSLLRVDPISGAQSLVSMGGLIDIPSRMAIGATGDVFVANTDGLGSHQILSIDPLTGSATTVSSGGLLSAEISGLAIDTGGDLIVSHSDTLLHIDPANGNQQTISTGGLMTSVSDLTIDVYQDLMVSDIIGEALLRVDAVSGTQQTEASGGIHSAAPPTAIAAVLVPSLKGDVNRDGVADIADMGLIGSNWGASILTGGGPGAAAATVPVPAAAWIAAVLAGAPLRRPDRYKRDSAQRHATR